VKREQSSGYDTILSITLLNRARLVASEHSKLSASLAENFDARVAKRLGEVTPITDTLKEWDKSTDVSSNSSAKNSPEMSAEIRNWENL
jgi:peptide chain release factor 1